MFPLSVSSPRAEGHNSLTDAEHRLMNREMDQEKPADSFPNTFVPGRNLFFLTIL